MTIWILALVFFVSLGLVGYNQGAIRVAMSMFGLIISSLLAGPLSSLMLLAIRPLLGAFSVKNPVILWMVAPLVTFLILLAIFKVVAFALHRQVEVYYKYKAGELRLALWERMNKRIGACLGSINALIYILLVSMVIYVMGYWTTQMAQGEGDSRSIRIVTRLAKDLHSTGLDKAARALVPMKEDFYVAGDIVGIVYHNPLANSRLSRYPTLLTLSERPEFAELGNDTAYHELLQRQPPISEILGHPKTQAIWGNPDLLKEIWGLLQPDLKDLREFMLTGKSAKYDPETILGRWSYDPAATYTEFKKSKPNLSVSVLKEQRKLIAAAFSHCSFVAMPSKQAILKDVAWINPTLKKVIVPDTTRANISGSWSGDRSGYTLALTDIREMTAKVDGNNLKLSGEWTPLVFYKEE